MINLATIDVIDNVAISVGNLQISIDSSSSCFKSATDLVLNDF